MNIQMLESWQLERAALLKEIYFLKGRLKNKSTELEKARKEASFWNPLKPLPKITNTSLVAKLKK